MFLIFLFLVLVFSGFDGLAAGGLALGFCFAVGFITMVLTEFFDEAKVAERRRNRAEWWEKWTR